MNKKLGAEMRLFVGNNEYTADELEAMELAYQLAESEFNEAMRLEVRRANQKETKPCES